MRIAAIRKRRWPEAVTAAGHACVELPPPPAASCFESPLEARIEHGRTLLPILRENPVELILDAYGDGMLFVDDPREKGMDALLHHTLGVPLVSHWTESFRVLFQGLDQALLHDALASPTWFKGIFTQAHLAEMEWMGVPGCFYLPLAADDGSWPTSPAVGRAEGPRVFFGGNQQSRYFAHDNGVDVRTQWPGAMALASVEDGSASSFLDAYRNLGLGPCPATQRTVTAKAEAVRRYYAQKMFFVAARNLTTRDRFLLRLRKELGDGFLLVGHERWEKHYGLTAKPPVEYAEYQNLIRTTPISVNMVNGDNDSGLNLRHFEITALGGFLLSYRHPELDGHFKIGAECDAFSNEAELLEKVEHYVAHPRERNRIAAAGRERTMNTHLLHHRLAAVLEWMRKEAHI